MPRKGANERIARYLLKLQPDRVKADLEAQRDHMAAAQSAAINELATIEDRVKGLLAEEDVPTVQYVWYHDFGREVYSLKAQFQGGKGLKREVDLLVYVWSERGASEDVLNRIALDLFGIGDWKPASP